MQGLVSPTARLRTSWLAAREEWGRETHQDGAGLRAGDDVDTVAGFAAWVERLRRESDPSIPLDQGLVHASYWWIVEDEEYLGAVSLRHTLNDFLLRAGGHIGYGVRPSARRRGLATWALGAVLPEACALGLTRVLVTCDDANVASARTIESNRGVLEDVRETELGLTRRYWIAL
jgi:predicted acetyltransferase